MKTSDATLLATPQSILLMGPPGGGKTTFALQWPALYVLDGDGNLAGPVRWLKSKELYHDFMYDSISLEESGTSITDPAKHWDRLKILVATAVKDPTIKTIFIDSLTHMDQVCQRWVMNRQRKTVIELGDWNIFKHELYGLLMSVKASGKTLLISCHEKIEYGSDFKIEKYVPAVSTNLKDYFGYMFSDVWRCVIKQDGAGKLKAVVATHPTALSDLKSSLLFGKGEINALYTDVEKVLKQ